MVIPCPFNWTFSFALMLNNNPSIERETMMCFDEEGEGMKRKHKFNALFSDRIKKGSLVEK